MWCVSCGGNVNDKRSHEVDGSVYCQSCVKQFAWYCDVCDSYHDIRVYKPIVYRDQIVCNVKKLKLKLGGTVLCNV